MRKLLLLAAALCLLAVNGSASAQEWPAKEPIKTPPAISARLNDEIIKALAVLEVKEEITNLAADPMPMSDFDMFVRNEIKLNAGIVKAAGIQPE